MEQRNEWLFCGAKHCACQPRGVSVPLLRVAVLLEERRRRQVLVASVFFSVTAPDMVDSVVLWAVEGGWVAAGSK